MKKTGNIFVDVERGGEVENVVTELRKMDDGSGGATGTGRGMAEG